jgi:hypothetical protein
VEHSLHELQALHLVEFGCCACLHISLLDELYAGHDVWCTILQSGRRKGDGRLFNLRAA